MTKPILSKRVERFTESVIREMTRLAQIHEAVNLAQGMPDFPAPDEIKTVACDAITADINQYARTDEIYEHILYDSQSHYSMSSISGMGDRTITINALSKTYSVTGWRVGYVIASPELTQGIRKVHDFLTVGAPAPLQEAGARAMALPAQYYTDLAVAYQRRRDLLHSSLTDAGFNCAIPQGAYYIMADFSELSSLGDIDFTKYLVKDIGIAVVPGSSFFHEPARGSRYVRFCFCKKDTTLQIAGDRLQKLR